MKLRALTVHPYHQRLALAGDIVARDRFHVRIEDSDGAIGVGDAGPWPPRTAPPAQVQAELLAVGKRLHGARLEPDAIFGLLEEIGGSCSSPARAGLDIAFGDWWSRRHRLPFAAFLAHAGGLAAPAPVPVWTNTVVATLPEAERAVAEGQRMLKVKLHDAAALEAFLAWAPQVAARFRLDPNRAFTAADMLAFWPRLRRLDLDYIEDPLPSSDRAGWHTLHDAGLPLALDEADSEGLFADGVAQVRVLKPQFEGGLLATLQRALAYRRAGRTVTITSALESRVGRAATIALAGLVDGARIHGLGPAEPTSDWTAPRGGVITPPAEMCGTGVECDAYAA